MKVGVFDSGVGGLSVANAISKAIPDLDVILREDKGNLPYGNKQPAELYKLVKPILDEMLLSGCEIIVIACNTVSTTIIKELRDHIDVPLIAIEPMIKPASEQTKSGTIAVCATPTTLRSERYAYLKKEYADNITVLEPDCSDWAAMIEGNNIYRKVIENSINSVLNNGADVIVLACTHYHWIEEEIETIAVGRAKVLQPEQAIIRQLKRVLEQLA